MANRYFYVHFLTPAGPGAWYWRGPKHFLAPSMVKEFQAEMAGKLALANGMVGLSPNMIFVVNAIELPEEVAKERWPEDFGGPSLKETKAKIAALEADSVPATPEPCEACSATLLVAPCSSCGRNPGEVR